MQCSVCALNLFRWDPPVLRSILISAMLKSGMRLRGVWFLIVDQFVGSFGVLFVDMICGQDVVTYFRGSFNGKPPKVGG